MAITPIAAVIFDMDGVLIESESLWCQAEREASDALGLGFSDTDFAATRGKRIREVTQLWFDARPWDGPEPDDVAQRIIDRVVELVADRPPMDGVREALSLLADRGVRLGLCTSSDRVLIDVVLAALGLEDAFEVVHSAQDDEFGKPHPLPYLRTAELLGIEPQACLVIEDSLSGSISAKSAGMRVVAVPDAAEAGSGRFGFADLTLESLTQLDGATLTALADGQSPPSVSRPRFHRAFPVDDLARARWFYSEVLGALEGRSSDTWVDFNLYGHQIVAHLVALQPAPSTNSVDGHEVPAEHSGVLLNPPAWRDLVQRLEGHGDRIRWLMEPTTRFAGLAGEQHTCFVADPAGNALEFKAFADDRHVFAR